MRDDRRASHDPARGGVIGGGALVARRPPYKPSNAGGDNSAPIVTGERPNSNLCSAVMDTSSILKLYNFILVSYVPSGLNSQSFLMEYVSNAGLFFYLIFNFRSYENVLGESY
jgi:hypothetical protein